MNNSEGPVNDSEGPVRTDARRLENIARLFRWDITHEPDGSMHMSRGHQTVRAVFTHDGAFWYARTGRPDAAGRELALAETLQALEHHDAAPWTPPGA